MANDFEVGVDVHVPPATAWGLAGNPLRIGEWFPAVATCEISGDERRGTLASGAQVVERLIDRDEAGMSYAYTVISGIPGLTSHRASIRVIEIPEGSRVIWHQTATSDIDGYDMEARIAPVMRAGLDRLRVQLEGDTTRSQR